MVNQPSIHLDQAAPGNRNPRARALARRAGVLVAAGAMIATVVAIAAPTGASATAADPSVSSPQNATSQAGGQTSPARAQASPSPTPTNANGWSVTGSMTTARVGHASTLLADGRVLVAGGHADTNPRGPILSSAELYNPSTGAWQAAANMPIAVADAAAVTLPNGTVLVAGGAGFNTELYKPTTNTWTMGPRMPAANFGTTFAAMLPNGKVFVLGTSATSYNPRNQKWKALAKPPHIDTTRNNSTTQLPNGDIATTETIQYACCMPQNAITGPSVYHWATNKWATMPVPPKNPGLGVAVAALPNGNIIIAGGVVDYLWFPERVATVMEVNPATGVWTYDADLPNGGELVQLPNGSTLATGSDPDYVYSSTADTWTRVTGRAISGASFTTLANGTILSAGGFGVTDTYPYQFFIENQASIFTP